MCGSLRVGVDSPLKNPELEFHSPCGLIGNRVVSCTMWNNLLIQGIFRVHTGSHREQSNLYIGQGLGFCCSITRLEDPHEDATTVSLDIASLILR